MSPKIIKPSIKHYLSYGLGACANGWTASTIGFYVNFYILSVLKLEPGHYTIIQIVTQVINAVSDPVFGLLSDRTHTRFGRRQPYILFSAFAMPLFYFLFFTAFPMKSQWATLSLYLFFFVCFYLSQTALNVPHLALVMELTDNEKSRNNFVAFASIFYAIGNLVGPLSLTLFRDNLLAEKSYNVSYSVASGISAILMSFMILSVFFGIKESNTELEYRSFKEIILDSVHVFRYKSYVYMMLAFISTQIAVQTCQFNLELFLKIVVKKNIMTYMMVITILSTILWIYPLKKSINRFGKRNTYLTSMIIFIFPFPVILFYSPQGNMGTLILLMMGIIIGLGTSAGFFISICMLNDVIVEDYIRVGHKREGVFNSSYVFFQKVTTGCVHGFIGLILQFVGLKRDENYAVISDQDPLVVNTLNYIITILPLCVIIPGCFWLYLYPLTPEKVEKNQKIFELINSKK